MVTQVSQTRSEMKHPASEAGGIFKKKDVTTAPLAPSGDRIVVGRVEREKGTEVSQHKQIYVHSHKLVFRLE